MVPLAAIALFARIAAKGYDQLVALLGEVIVVELVGEDETAYQIEIEVVWDGKPEGDIRSSAASMTWAGAPLRP